MLRMTNIVWVVLALLCLFGWQQSSVPAEAQAWLWKSFSFFAGYALSKVTQSALETLDG